LLAHVHSFALAQQAHLTTADETDTIKPINNAMMIGMKHPNIEPNLRCRPERLQGIPTALPIFCLAAVIPNNLFHENPP